MARKKKLTPEQEIQQYRECLMEVYERWGEIKMHGCSDPAQTDGQSLNLVRDNIGYYVFRIVEICVIENLPHPPELELCRPPEAPAGYMASLAQIERVERLRSYGQDLTTEWE